MGEQFYWGETIMENIFIITEGQAEEKFYKSVFADYFGPTFNFQVTCMPNKRNAYSRINKGGTISYDLCVKNINRFIKGATHCNKVFLIYDYYGLHKSFFNGYSGYDNTNKKINFIISKLENEINNPKFKFILQVHEFEAFLFSKPEEIVKHYNNLGLLKEFNSILSRHNNNPEEINDSPDTAPSKRIINIFPQYEFGKTSDGIVIAKNIGIDNIRKRCENFNNFCSLLQNSQK